MTFEASPSARSDTLPGEARTQLFSTLVESLCAHRSRDVDIQKTASLPVPLIVDFDNPHVGADVTLRDSIPPG